MNEPFLTRQDLDERAEFHQAGHAAQIGLACGDVVSQALDDLFARCAASSSGVAI